MTNKKSIWAFVLAFMLVVPAMFLFSACGRKHQHTFSAEWTRTETEHYHAATCEHGEEKRIWENIVASGCLKPLQVCIKIQLRKEFVWCADMNRQGRWKEVPSTLLICLLG